MRITKKPTAVSPRYSDYGAAGMDLYVDTEKEYILEPGQTYMLPTGISIELPRYHFGAIYPRSSLHKKGLTLANNVGIIDSSYRGEIILPVKNIFSDIIRINGQWGLRVPLAQLIIQPYRYERIEVVDSLSETPRGDGGFGSTDEKNISYYDKQKSMYSIAERYKKAWEDGQKEAQLKKNENIQPKQEEEKVI